MGTQEACQCLRISLLGLDLALVPVAPATAAPKAKPARELPALATPPQPQVRPERPGGDFTDPPPHPDQLGQLRPTPKGAFDPARSQVVEADTTPTRKVWSNPDGSRTEELSVAPVRFRDGQGAWRDIDLGLVTGAGGTLRARASENRVELPATADGPVVLETPAGPLTLRHLDAAPVPATVEGATATYASALGRRDLRLALTTQGLEEFVILPDAAAGGSYRETLTLPAGLSARDGERGVELVDGVGTVVARVESGWANDAVPGLAPPAPVSVRLVAPPSSAAPREVTIEASVDPAWLADPARVFPVTVDPSITIFRWATDGDDTMVFNGTNANTNFGTYPELWVSEDGATLVRSYLRFNNLPAPSPNMWVSESNLTLYNSWSSCTATPRPLEVGPRQLLERVRPDLEQPARRQPERRNDHPRTRPGPPAQL